MFLFPFDFQWFVCGRPACGFLCIYIAWGSLSCLNLRIDAFRQIWGIPGPRSFLWVLCVPHAFSSHPALLTVTRGSDSDASSAPFPGFCLPSASHHHGLSVGPPLTSSVLSFVPSLLLSSSVLFSGFHLDLRLRVWWGWGRV